MAETAVKQGIKNEKIGMVVSTAMQKTIAVEVSRRVPHPLYKRIIGKRKKFYAHDEEGRAKVGDVVHHRMPPVEQVEAVAAGGHRPPRGPGGRAARGVGCEDLNSFQRSAFSDQLSRGGFG